MTHHNENDWEGFRASVMARLEVSDEESDCEDWLFEPDLEPMVSAVPVYQWLVEDSAAAVLKRPASEWASFTTSVMEQLEGSYRVGFTEWLREDSEQALLQMDGKWRAFRHQILGMLDGPISESLEQQALRLLRVDVDEEVQTMAPAFEGPFGAQVDDRMRPTPSWSERFSAWVRRNVAAAMLGSMSAAAATAALVMMVTATSVDPISGQVSVDSIAFEGDTMVIPDDGVTIVIVSSLGE